MTALESYRIKCRPKSHVRLLGQNAHDCFVQSCKASETWASVAWFCQGSRLPSRKGLMHSNMAQTQPSSVNRVPHRYQTQRYHKKKEWIGCHLAKALSLLIRIEKYRHQEQQPQGPVHLFFSIQNLNRFQRLDGYFKRVLLQLWMMLRRTGSLYELS